MNTTKHNFTIFLACFVLFSTTCFLQAGGHRHSKPRDIDRAIHIADIVLRALFPSQTVIVEQPSPVTYTTPFYQSTTVVTTPTVVTPVYSQPVYVAPTYYYFTPTRIPAYRPQPQHNHYRPPTRHYTPPRRNTPPPRHSTPPPRPTGPSQHGQRSQRRR